MEGTEFWTGSHKSYNVQPIRYQPSAMRVVYSDVGFGGYVVEHGPRAVGQPMRRNKVQLGGSWLQ